MKRERIPVRLLVIAAAEDAEHQTERKKHLDPLWQQGPLKNWRSVNGAPIFCGKGGSAS